MNKKKLLSLALVVVMIATISFSSLAWFTDSDLAKNNFTIGGANEEENPDHIFSVDIKELVDGEEEAVEDWGFENILPGDHFKKEAYITNTGSYEQYIRVVMKITDWKLIKDVVTINMADDFKTNWPLTGGVSVNSDGNLTTQTDYSIDENGTLVVVMYLDKKLQPGETVNIMDYVEISTAATQNDFANAAFADGFQITFDADAVQTKNILKDNEYSNKEWLNAKTTFEKLG